MLSQMENMTILLLCPTLEQLLENFSPTQKLNNSKEMSVNLSVEKSGYAFWFKWWPLKGPEFWVQSLRSFVQGVINLQIHRGYVLASWGHRQHPWLWQSSSWHAQCRWQHPWLHSPKTPWGLLWSPHRWVRKYAWLLPSSLNDGLLA